MSREFIDDSLPSVNRTRFVHERATLQSPGSSISSQQSESLRGPSFYKLIKELREKFPIERRPKIVDRGTVEEICHETGERLSALELDRTNKTVEQGKHKGVSFSPRTLAADALVECSSSDLDQLLNTGLINVNEIDDNGESLLHRAAEEGHIDCIRVLIKHGANVNIKNKDGWPPVHFALTNSNLSAMVYLLECGADMTEYTKQRIEEFKLVERISKQVYKEEEVFV